MVSVRFNALLVVSSLVLLTSPVYSVPVLDQISQYCHGLYQSCEDYVNFSVSRLFYPSLLGLSPGIARDVWRYILKEQELWKRAPMGSSFSFIKEGLVFSNGDSYHSQKKQLLPFFERANLDKMLPYLNADTQHLVNEMKNALLESKDSLSKPDAMSALLFDTFFNQFMTTQMGLSSEEYNQILVEYAPGRFSMYELYHAAFGRDVQVNFLSPLSLYNRFKFVSDRNDAVETWRNVFDDIIRMKNSKPHSLPFTTLLDLIMGDETKATDQSFAQFITFLVAAIDNSKISLLWAICGLSMNQEAQSQLRYIVVNGSQDEANKALDAVLKEAFQFGRMEPIIPREAVQDIDRNVTNQGLAVRLKVPKGQVIIDMSSVYVHLKFPPGDNMIFEPFVDRERPPLLTFGAGARSCIGQRLAMMQMRTVLEAVIRHFKWSTSLKDVYLKAGLFSFEPALNDLVFEVL